MSKNKFGKYNVGDKVIFEKKEVIIVEKFKGNKTKQVNKQGGIRTGFISNPCLYRLDNGFNVRGDKLLKIYESNTKKEILPTQTNMMSNIKPNAIILTNLGIGCIEMPTGITQPSFNVYNEALEAAMKEVVLFKDYQEITFLAAGLNHWKLEKGKLYPIPEGYEIKIIEDFDSRDSFYPYIYAILIPKQDLEEERNRLLELQADKTRWFSQQEFDRLKELSLKLFGCNSIEEAAKKYANITHNRPLDEEERYYKDYQKYDSFIAGAKSDAAKEYWFEIFKKEKK